MAHLITLKSVYIWLQGIKQVYKNRYDTIFILGSQRLFGRFAETMYFCGEAALFRLAQVGSSEPYTTSILSMAYGYLLLIPPGGRKLGKIKEVNFSISVEVALFGAC
jgi:hypothetical protein